RVPARLAKRLIAGAAPLAIPDGFVDDGYRRQDRDLLQPKNQVREIGNRAVAVLEVESVEELLGLLSAELADGFEHSLARARVLCQRVRLNLGRYASHRVHPTGRRRR